MSQGPLNREIEKKIELQDFQTAWPYLERELVEPGAEFLSRPSKHFRGELVSLAFELVHPQGAKAAAEPRCEKAARLLESLHAGSLVVDDIQDDSLYRRGKATLHRMYGVGRALNVGNWLYFDALDSISEWNLPAETEVEIWRLCHRALNRAHFGQGLDLGVAIDQVARAEVKALCLSSLELKTGALMELAFGLGAALAGANEGARQPLLAFGREFGVALQMLDDLGNLDEKTIAGVADGKQYEDLKLRRPSWVWATAATHYDDAEFAKFVSAVRELPATAALKPLLNEILPGGQRGAHEFLDGALARLQASPAIKTETARVAAKRLAEQVARLKGAYVGKQN